VTIEDTNHLLERPNPEWPLDKVITAKFNTQLSTKIARTLAAVTEVAPNWRKAFTQNSAISFKENTNARLNG